MKLVVKHGSTTHDVEVDGSAKALALQDELQRITGVFARQQKIIFKGKVLDPTKLLTDQGVTEGKQLMLLATAGSTSAPVMTKGQQAARDASLARAAEAKERLTAAFASATGKVIAPSPTTAVKSAVSTLQSSLIDRRRAWAKIGIVALRDLGLEVLPEEVLQGLGASSSQPSQPFQPSQTGSEEAQEACMGSVDTNMTEASSCTHTAVTAPSQAQQPTHPPPALGSGGSSGSAGAVIRACDVSHNHLPSLPASLFSLTGLTSLKLSHNALTLEGISWPSLSALSALTLLTLDHNRLEGSLPSHISALSSLKALNLSHNKITDLPPEITHITGLQLLDISDNALTGTLPPFLGGLTSLVELSGDGNKLTGVAEELGGLKALQVLTLERNLIGSLPPAVLQGTSSLWCLSLASNPLAADALRVTEGFAAYDARRRAKVDKQIGGSTLVSSARRALDEGADAQGYERWAGALGRKKD